MLNYIAFYLLDFLLRTPVLQAPGSNTPVSAPELPTAVLPQLFGSPVNLGFPLVVVLTLAAAATCSTGRASASSCARSGRTPPRPAPPASTCGA